MTTRHKAAPVDLPLADMVDGWILELRAANKSAGTIKKYTEGVRTHIAWCEAHGIPRRLDRRTITAHIADMLELDDEGQPRYSAFTARNQLVCLKSFSRWLVAEGELEVDEARDVVQPKLGEHMRPPLSHDDVRAILATCDGKTFMGRRDEAIIRLLLDSGGRAHEIVSLKTGDLMVTEGHALVHGKGNRDRFVPFRVQTARALDRYLRARRKHARADSPALWLGDAGREFRYAGLWRMIKRRAEAAGIRDVHPHRFRRTMADWWLDAGGSEGGLKAVAGWRSDAMLRHYTAARANQRGLDEARRLDVGDV